MDLIAFTVICFALQPEMSLSIGYASKLLQMMGSGTPGQQECVNHEDLGRLSYPIAYQIPYDHPAHQKLVTLIKLIKEIGIMCPASGRCWSDFGVSLHHVYCVV